MYTILVIEDEVNIRNSVEEVLKHFDYNVITADNGKTGMLAIENHHPDLILCDVMMPEMDGYQVLSELKKDPLFDTPFIFLTAMAQFDDLRKGMNLGADDYIFKPFKTADLLKTIENRFSKKERTAQIIGNKLNELEKMITLMVGHEFNTPMNGIKSMSSLIKKQAEKYNNEEMGVFVNYLESSANRLQKTFTKIKNIFEIQGRKKENRIEDSHSPINLILTEIAQKIAEEFGRKDDLIIDISSETVLQVDQKLFQLCIYEIIENAFKFSSSGNLVIISTHCDLQYCRVSISDRGNFINPEQLSMIKPFHQFNREINEQQGLGAGLTLVKTILAYMGGEISFAQNQPTGIITTLTFKSI